MSKKKWKPTVGQKCLCIKPPSRFFKDDTLVVVPKDIGRHWSWVGYPNHAGVDDVCSGLLVETPSLRPILPKSPVTEGDCVAVLSAGRMYYGSVSSITEDRREFRITSGPETSFRFRWNDVTITKLVQKPK